MNLILINTFSTIECDINNKITFKSENWEAKKYNLLSHNCQTFGTEVIKKQLEYMNLIKFEQ